MNSREGKEGSWKRGTKGMTTKEGEEEPGKRVKAKPERRTKGWPIKWKGASVETDLKSFIFRRFLPSLP